VVSPRTAEGHIWCRVECHLILILSGRFGATERLRRVETTHSTLRRKSTKGGLFQNDWECEMLYLSMTSFLWLFPALPGP